MKSDWFKENMPIVVFLSCIVLIMAFYAAFYDLYGHVLVTAMYEGRSTDILNRFFMPRDSLLPLGSYLEFADRIFHESLILILFFSLFFAVFLFFLRKAEFKKPEPLEWFYLICGFFLTQWYFWLMDDAFVYFRYVDNLLFLDAGLVYNKGEYVEGFSSPLWALILLMFRATGASYWLILRLLAGLSIFVFWFMLVQLNAKFSPRTPVVNFPMAYLIFNYGVLCYFSSGLETPLVLVTAVAFALYIVNPASMSIQIILSLSPLVRHELALPFFLCILWAWFYHGKFPLRMVLMSVLFTGAWVIFRVYYYADFFPNTYYLKDMVNFYQGRLYILDTVKTYYAHLIAFIFIAAAVFLKIKRHVNLEISKRLMMIFTSLSIALYVVKIGGDFCHFRFTAFPFVLTVCAFSGVLEDFIAAVNLNRFRILPCIIGVMVSLVVFTLYPPQLGSHPFFYNASHRRIDGIDDVATARQVSFFSYLSWGPRVNPEIFGQYMKEYGELRYNDIKATYGCRASYILFDKKIIQSLGLTEAVLAHTETHEQEGEFRPGHKTGLIPLADDILLIHKSSPKAGRGMYRYAAEHGIAPQWIRDNLESIEIIERKIYNSHDFMENLKLGFTFPGKIKINVPASDGTCVTPRKGGHS
ncbi:MAG: hypothetical protein HY809_08645 [Nitrospirae bacterium]|nr:hypothetical protein [Nitrospirota bacterium]